MNSEDQNRDAHANEGRNWRQIHHSPVFWVGIVLCLAFFVMAVITHSSSAVVVEIRSG